MEIPFNLLILPFLGGYIFVRFFNYFRIHTMRSDKERILIRSSLAGFTSLVIAWSFWQLGKWTFPCGDSIICVPLLWEQLVPFENSGIALASFLIAALAWIPLNRWKGSSWPFLCQIPPLDRESEIDRAIQEDADPLEMMLKRSKDETLAVAITMTNEKVYIGQVVHIFNPATPTNNIGLLPLQSGFRDPQTKEMHLTIDYAVTMQNIRNELDEADSKIRKLESTENTSIELTKARKQFKRLEETLSMFSLVIPVNQIASVHIFDSNVHSRYFQPTQILNSPR